MVAYTKTIELEHDERAAKVNVDTGEIKLVHTPDPKFTRNKDQVSFKPDELFAKSYTRAWKLLETQTTNKEFLIACKLGMKALPFNNCLKPLSDETTIRELAEEFGISTRDVDKVFDKLFKLGVYGKWEVAQQDKPFKKFWVFNPYLSFNGKTIDRSVADFFKGTFYANISR